MALEAGARLTGEDLYFPAQQTGFGNGGVNITATAYAAVPTYPASASITNPHASKDLRVQLDLMCWVNSISASALRVAVDTSGAVTVAAGTIGAGVATSFAQIIRAFTQGQYSATLFADIPAGTTTFAVHAHKESGAATINLAYPTVIVTPKNYV